MTELNLTHYFLTGIIANGPWMLALALFVGALGVPLPGTFFVLATGAFIQQEVLNSSALLAGLVGVVIGDMLSYSLGRLAKVWVGQRWNHLPRWQAAQSTFDRRGGVAVFLTRFLLTPLAVPTNLVAGSSGYHPARFLLYDSAGEVIWLLLYGSLGYVFGTQWELVSEYMGNVSGLLVGIAVVGIGIYLLNQRRGRNEIQETL